MATENLKDFAIQWTLFGILFISLFTFAGNFVLENNPTSLGKDMDKLNGYKNSMSNNLISIENETNALLNISSQSNPEESYLGSRDSVATSFSITGIAKNSFTNFKLFLGWMFGGKDDVGYVLISIFVSLFALSSLYFITKWIRTGQ